MLREEITINQPGLSIRVGNRIIKTPANIKLTESNIAQVENQLISYGMRGKIFVNNPHRLYYKTGYYSMGCEKDPRDDRDYKFSTLESNGNIYTSIPNRVDYRKEMSSVKSQASSPMCVGFAVAACKEYQAQKEYEQKVKNENYKYRRKRKEYNLSEQWIYYKAKEIDPWGPDTAGTSVRAGVKVVHNKGVPPEKGWKFNDSKKGSPKRWADLMSNWQLSGNYFRIETVDELLKAVYNYGPVPIGIVCFEEIFNPGSNGLVPYPSNPQRQYGGHAIAIEMFDTRKELVGFKNSWGRDNWGNNGHGLLPFRYLRDFMMDAWVMTDVNVDKELFVEGR